ncbi:MAG: 30S ribosomal protein S11 [Planctomycetales bacterium]|nr:30S ribosomal protein S11 [bacterium]UNM07916.1 MAG: 30S ribosomal protein S11 [Planctomycetales bacterium]
MAGPKKGGSRKREKRHVPSGVVHIKASFNNTQIAVTDPEGNVVAWSSAGAKGFKGAKKGTAYAAQTACETAVRKVMDWGLREVEVYSKGPGSGKEAAIRTLSNLGLRIKLIRDVTPVAHNGVRPKGRRRV